MIVYYNIIWIIFIILLFIALFAILWRKRSTSSAADTTHPSDYVVVDINGTPLHNQTTQPATYAPPPPTQPQQPGFTTYRPTDSSVEPPPPSYQDYSKDYRVHQTQ